MSVTPPRRRELLRRITPAQSLALGFSSLTLVGAWLLTLPVASAAGSPTPFIDALFTATSAITTTGLIVVDTGSYYSLFGQLVVLVLFQLGGLGYMVFIAFLTHLVGSRLSLTAGISLSESLPGARLGELRDFVRSVILFTVFFEALGTIALGLFFMQYFPAPRAFYLSAFHAVSAFCTAGFSLFADSFTAYGDSATVNLTVAVVTVAGGMGFFVLRDLSAAVRAWVRRQRRKPLSTHSSLALAVSVGTMLGGSVLLFLSERSFGALPLLERFWAATFQGLSAATTTGFNTVDIGALTATGQFLIIALMFVGASPGGTAGGIKTTTLGVVVLSAIALLKGGHDTVAFKRRLPQDTVYRALTIGMLATVVIVTGTLLLTITEKGPFMPILFETVSALGTVGLSAGITPGLSLAGKATISIIMLIGRLGILAVGFALVGRPQPVRFRYMEGAVFVG